MLDPFDDEASQKAQSEIESVNFSTYVYTEEKSLANTQQDITKLPKCTFLPSQELVRKMIRAIFKWGATDTEEAFFLRFGLLEDPNWYLNTPTKSEME